MKVIDLLNKIVNGEEVPKKIKYRNKIFIYDKDNLCYVVENYNEYYDLHMSLSNHKGTDLNYEVEIIEEDKKIERLPYYDYSKIMSSNSKQKTVELMLEKHEKRLNDNWDKINELIDEVNKLKDESR